MAIQGVRLQQTWKHLPGLRSLKWGFINDQLPWRLLGWFEVLVVGFLFGWLVFFPHFVHFHYFLTPQKSWRVTKQKRRTKGYLLVLGRGDQLACLIEDFYFCLLWWRFYQQHTCFSSASQNNYSLLLWGGKNPLNHEYSAGWLTT